MLKGMEYMNRVKTSQSSYNNMYSYMVIKLIASYIIDDCSLNQSGFNELLTQNIWITCMALKNSPLKVAMAI